MLQLQLQWRPELAVVRARAAVDHTRLKLAAVRAHELQLAIVQYRGYSPPYSTIIFIIAIIIITRGVTARNTMRGTEEG